MSSMPGKRRSSFWLWIGIFVSFAGCVVFARALASWFLGGPATSLGSWVQLVLILALFAMFLTVAVTYARHLLVRLRNKDES